MSENRAGHMAEVREAMSKLSPAELEGAMRQLEGIMEALPPDVESTTDAHIRHGLEALTMGYRIAGHA